MSNLTDEDKQWIIDQLETVKADFSTKLERVETALLTAFHKWASPMEIRVRSHSAYLRAIDVELEAVTDRVTKLEGRQ